MPISLNIKELTREEKESYMRNATPIQPQLIDNFHLLLIHAGSKIRLSRQHQYHYESILSLFWKIFEEKGVSLSTDEWHIFLDCLFEFLTSRNALKNSDITDSENQDFLLRCAKAYALLSQEYLHLYSKKLTIYFLFSAAVTFAKSEQSQTERNLLDRISAIRAFLINLICLTINEETLCHLTESLIYNDDLCNEEALTSYYEKLIQLKNLGFDLNQLLTFDNHTKKISIVADEMNTQLLQPLKFLFKKTEEPSKPILIEIETTREIPNTPTLIEETSPRLKIPIFAPKEIDSPTAITDPPH